jgi:hypothetical protein
MSCFDLATIKSQASATARERWFVLKARTAVS